MQQRYTLPGPVPLQPLIDYAHECLSAIPHSSKMGITLRFRNRFTHCMRVKGWCERLLTQIPARRDVVLAAAILHDIGYTVSAAEHAYHGAKMAQGFLAENGYEEEFTHNVADLILQHSNKRLDARKMSNELIILQDADCLDEIGALTVFWDCMAEGATDEQNYKKTYERLLASYIRIHGRNRVLKSTYGDHLYRERLEVLRRFIRQIEYELFI